MGCASRSAPRTRPAAWRKRCANWWARHDDDGSGTLMPPFSRVTVIGLGLIGSSIARGIRARMPDVRVTGYDASAEVRDTARAIDLCDAVPDSAGASVADADLGVRSEEHTSELQSLMRISY